MSAAEAPSTRHLASQAAGLSSATPGAVPDPGRWRVLAFLALSQFVFVLDLTVVNVALPSIQHDLHFSRSGLAWVVDGYVLTAGGLLLLGGRLADLLGRRRMFLTGLGLFTVASVLSGTAQNPATLVAARFLQGAGEALAGPAAFGLVVLLFPYGADRTRAVGIFTGVAGLGGVVGPVISGLLVKASWRYIFFLNVPVALVVAVVVVRLVSESRADSSTTRSRPDLVGAALVTGGVSSLVFGLIGAATHPWTSPRVSVPLAVGGVLLAAFARAEAVIANPLVPHGFFRNRVRVATNLATLCFGAVFLSFIYLLTLYWIQLQGYSALHAAVAYAPSSVALLTGVFTATALQPRTGIKPLIVAGLTLTAAGMLLLSSVQAHGDYVSQVLPGLMLATLGAGLLFPSFGVGSVHDVSEQDASLASAVQNATQQIGGAIGIAVLSTLSLRRAAGDAARGIDQVRASVNGDVLAFRTAAVFALAGLVVAVTILRNVRPDPEPAVSEPRGDPSLIQETH